MNAPLTVFLDRDGVINVEKEYLYRIEDFAFIPGAPEAIARLNRAGALVIVVTNQAGIAHGYYTEADVQRLHDYMIEELARSGAHLDAIYMCPYHPKGAVPEYAQPSRDRKPEPGMFEQAIRDFNLRDDRRFVIGDKFEDLLAGREAGCVTVLVRTGYGDTHLRERPGVIEPDYVADALPQAVEWILDFGF